MFDDIDKRIDEFLKPIGQKYQKYKLNQLNYDSYLK